MDQHPCSFYGKIYPCFHQLRALRMGVVGGRHERVVIASRLLPVPRQLGRFCSTVESTVSVACRLQRGFVLLQGQRRLVGRKEQIAEELTHGPKPVLHRDVLFAPILEVCRSPHQRQSRIPLIVPVRDPSSARGPHDLHLLGPIVILGPHQSFPGLLQLLNIDSCGAQVAAARRTHGTSEVSYRIGHWSRGLQRKCGSFDPGSSLDRVARRDRCEASVASKGCSGWTGFTDGSRVSWQLRSSIYTPFGLVILRSL